MGNVLKTVSKKLLQEPLTRLLWPIVNDVAQSAVKDILKSANEGRLISRDIRSHRQQLASIQTAEYVNRHMPYCQSFASKEDLLRFAAGHVTPDLKGGLHLECGVHTGGSINLLATLFTPKTVYGFDSFEGLQEDWQDGVPKGTFKLNGLPKVKSNVELVKGYFEDTLPPFLSSHPGPVCFLHVDSDLYSSAATIFNHLEGASRLVPGTVIVFDEYFNYPAWEDGEYRAFQEFIERSGLGYKYISYVRTSEQVAVQLTEGNKLGSIRQAC